MHLEKQPEVVSAVLHVEVGAPCLLLPNVQPG